MERNFEIGDIAICLNKEYYSNPYYNGFGNSNEFIKASKVSDIYEYAARWCKKVFYLFNRKHQVDSIGDSCSYQYNEYCDADGISTNSPRNTDEVWMNYTKNPSQVFDKIQEIKEEFHQNCEELRAQEKQEIILKIRNLQKRLEALEQGDTFTYLGQYRSEKEWNEKMNEVINKVISKVS